MFNNSSLAAAQPITPHPLHFSLTHPFIHHLLFAFSALLYEWENYQSCELVTPEIDSLPYSDVSHINRRDIKLWYLISEQPVFICT